MNEIKYSYDVIYDFLTVFIDKAINIKSEEIDKNVFMIYNEDDRNLIGIEILDYSTKYKSLCTNEMIPSYLKEKLNLIHNKLFN